MYTPRMAWPGREEAKLVLIVEDDDLSASLLAQILEGQGFKTRRARDGEEALEMAEKHFPDIVLLDIMLPRVHGADVLLRLKSNPKVQDIPVIMCSSLKRLEDVEKYFRWGAAGYLAKPFDAQRLLDNIDAALA